MGDMTNAYKILVGKPEGKRPLGRPKHRCEDNITTNLKEIWWQVVDWIHLAQKSDKWRAPVIAVINFRLP
jgi:hypothetical protein